MIGVGASAGGIEAIRTLLSTRADLGAVALVLVTHLDPARESRMAEIVAPFTSLEVRRIETGDRLRPGTLHVLPPGHGLTLSDGVLRLTAFPLPRGLRRPIDDFFAALAADLGPRAAGIVLSGTGADGAQGLAAIKAAGGLVAAQAPEEAQYGGMPEAAAALTPLDVCGPAAGLLPSLLAAFETGTAQDGTEALAPHLPAICAALLARTGNDMSGYRPGTILRRIARRMDELGIAAPETYLARLRADAAEAEALLDLLTINVTRFFRDGGAFEALRAGVLGPLVRSAAQEARGLRLWVAGCSSGEEAASLAMLLRAEMEAAGTVIPAEILATDIDLRRLETARAGLYPLAARQDIPAALRARFTQEAGGGQFRLHADARDMIRYSRHNLIKDPPFARIDVICCRNLLIYFGETLQRAVLPLLHYALRPGGALLLGPSESIGRADDLFEPVDHGARLFRRRPGPARYPLTLPGRAAAPGPRPAPAPTPAPTHAASPAATPAVAEALAQMVRRHAPPALLVDPEGSILATWGPVERYFRHSGDPLRHGHAPSLAPGALRDLIGPMIRATAEDLRPRRLPPLSIETDFGQQELRVSCEPVRGGDLLLVLRETGPLAPRDGAQFVDYHEPETGRVARLESEIQRLRHRLRASVEELETANEELRGSNEEMMAVNAELQARQQDLGTVNEELRLRLEDLSLAQGDLETVLGLMRLGTVRVDADLRVRAVSGETQALAGIGPAQTGRALAALPWPLGDPAVGAAVGAAVGGAGPQGPGGGQVCDLSLGRAGSAPLALRIAPLRAPSGRAGGATILIMALPQGGAGAPARARGGAATEAALGARQGLALCGEALAAGAAGLGRALRAGGAPAPETDPRDAGGKIRR